MSFKPAVNYERFLRLALAGPPKSGKTFLGIDLALAMADGGKVAIIDTENASASKYVARFHPQEFDVCELSAPFSPDTYANAILEAEKLGYKVLLVDSLSHAWTGPGGALEEKGQLALSGKKGMNDWTAWNVVTPKHNRLMHALTHVRMHVISTMRTKIEYEGVYVEGKLKINRLGTSTIQREETEYEFDILGLLDQQHTLTIGGSRCPELDHVEIALPTGASLATTIRKWLAGKPLPPLTEQQKAMQALFNEFQSLFPNFCTTTADWHTVLLTQTLGTVPAPEEYGDDHVEKLRAYVNDKKRANLEKRVKSVESTLAAEADAHS